MRRSTNGYIKTPSLYFFPRQSPPQTSKTRLQSQAYERPYPITRFHRSSRKSIQSRKQSGHWEADTIVSRQSRPALQIVVERKARYTFLNWLPNREAASMRKTMNKVMCKLPPKMRRTITYDNGTENVEHRLVNASRHSVLLLPPLH